MIGRCGDIAARRDWFGLEQFSPGKRFSQDGARLFLLDDVGSTNDFLFGQGEPAIGRLCHWQEWGWQAESRRSLSPVSDLRPGTVVVARQQSCGRGRQGRRWEDCGGLHLSTLIPSKRVSIEQGFSVWLGLQVILCLRESFNLDARLKWPNDILISGRKLGGLLIEKRKVQNETVIVAGLGLNLHTSANEFPSPLQGNATSVFMETGRTLRRAELTAAIIRRVETEFECFCAQGWAPYRPALSYLDCLLGRYICLQAGIALYKGKSAGIDDSGNLLLKDTAGIISVFSAGEVHLLTTG